jgi:hypothetical protein
MISTYNIYGPFDLLGPEMSKRGLNGFLYFCLKSTILIPSGFHELEVRDTSTPNSLAAPNAELRNDENQA